MVSEDPKPDYIIVFKTGIDANSPDKAAAHQAAQDQYSNLLGVLKSSGLEATGRNGGKGSETLLIFVRATEKRVQAELHRERLSDWLHGVASTRPSPREPQDFATEPVTPAERLRLVYAILATARTSTSQSVTNSASSGSTAGLSPLPSPPNFDRITAIFPPHDLAFNKKWLENWSSRSHIVSIPPEELVEVKNVYGETIALYHAFLLFYFRALAIPAALGLLCWLLGWTFSPFYAGSLVLWSIVFVEAWRVKEKMLSVEWGTYGADTVETQRPEFQGSDRTVDPVTGVEVDTFPFHRTLLRQLLSIPVLFAFASFLACLISTIYTIETLFGEVYEGSGKRYLTLVPTCLFVGIVPQVVAIWDKTARRLTAWENHQHQSAHDASLTLKVFALNFFTAYGSLLLTSYVYIPFGSHLVPHILSLLPSHHASALSERPAASFSINSSKLHTQLVAYTLTNQIVGAFTEIGVPMILRLLTKEVAKVQEKRKGGVDDTAKDAEDEHEFLERVRAEAALPEYTVFHDYAEMALQFGYATLFSLVWPVAPLWSFINNFVELRSDAFKLATQSRRPVPTRGATIGPWLDALGFITWLGALTNASLVYLYRPHLASPAISSKLSSLLNSIGSGVVPSFASVAANNGTTICTTKMELASSTSSIPLIRSTLWTALLVALATEHVYLLARGSVRFLLHHMYWKGSDAENWIRRSNLDLKKGYLDEMNMRKGPEELSELSGAVERAEQKRDLEKSLTGEDQFWSRGDVGLDELRRKAKTE